MTDRGEPAGFAWSGRQFALLAALTLVWGCNWPVMKSGIAAFPPLTFRVVGLWIGVACLALAMRWTRTPFAVPKSAWRQLALLTVTNLVVWHVLAIVCLRQLPSGRAAILGYTMPVFSALAGYALYGERLTSRQLLGVVAATVGVALLLSHELDAVSGHPLAACGMLVAAATWGLGTQQLRRTTIALPTLALIFWMTALTTVVMTVLALAFEVPRWTAPDGAAWFGIVYNGFLIIAFAQPVWLLLARTLPPIASTLSVMAIPVVGTVSGAWARHERLYWQDGAAMALMGVAIASVLARRRRTDRAGPG